MCQALSGKWVYGKQTVEWLDYHKSIDHCEPITFTIKPGINIQINDPTDQ